MDEATVMDDAIPAGALAIVPAIPAFPPEALAQVEQAMAEVVERSSGSRLHQDAWTWVALYEDGSGVAEIDSAGYDVHALADVDLARVVRFVLVPCRPGLSTPSVALDPAKGQQLLFARRHRLELSQVAEQAPIELVYHLLGWRQGTGDATVCCITYWGEDGSVLVCDDETLA